MYAVKETSTNQLNKHIELNRCPVTYTLDKISGRWKVLILHQLLGGTKRYAEIKRGIPSITEKMLIQSLKELEADKLIIRKQKPVVPPHVVYSMSGVGMSLSPVLDAMAAWGDVHKYDKEPGVVA